jgi:hypothetical protein
MKKSGTKNVSDLPRENRESELLILPDGRILVHNLTQPFAELLHELNPAAEQISSRLSRRSDAKADITHHASRHHEFPN